MQAELYAENYPARRVEAFIRSGGQCENMLSREKRCPVKLGDMRITRSGWLQFEQLICHHPNGDPENPDAELLFVCWACHMRLHRRPGPGRSKASARKQGYQVIRIPPLMEKLASAGLLSWEQPDGRIGWQIGTLCGEAHDHIEAITTAVHWAVGELRSLQETLEQVQTDVLTPEERDLIVRRRDAERRRASDRALREETLQQKPAKGVLAYV